MLLALALATAPAHACDGDTLSIDAGALLARVRTNRPGEDCETDGNQDGDGFALDHRDPDCNEEFRALLDTCGYLGEAYPEGFSGDWAIVPGFTAGGTAGGKIVPPLGPEPFTVVETEAGPLWVGRGYALAEGLIVIGTDPESVLVAMEGGQATLHAAFQLTEGVGTGELAIVAEMRATGLTVGLLDDATGLQWTAGPGEVVAPVLK